MKALVNKIINFSFVDGPGNRMAIFLQGCNFNCINCHNPQTINLCNHCGICVSSCPKGALTIKDNKVEYDIAKCVECDQCLEVCPNKSTPKASNMSVDDIFKKITELSPFIEGITVSGGEATLQLDFVTQLFKRVKEETNLTTFLDSNGFLDKQGWDKVLPYTDGVMLDIKAYGTEVYKAITGRDGSLVFESAKTIADKGKLYEVRTLVIPGIIDKEDEIKNISSFIKNIDENVRYKLLTFRTHGVKGELSKAQQLPRAAMDDFKSLAKAQGLKKVEIR